MRLFEGGMHFLVRYKYFIVMLVLLILLIGGAVFTVVKNKPASQETTTTATQTSESSAAAYGLVDKELPEFTVKDKDGQSVTSTKFSGKPMIVMEWASWCPHCHKMMPVMNKVYKKYKDKVNFVFIDAIGSNNGSETQETAEKYIDEKGFQMPIYFDDNLKVAAALQVEGIPTAFYVNSEGTVKQVTVSEMTQDEVEKIVEEIL